MQSEKRLTIGLDERSKVLRLSIINMLDAARRGHPASALSVVEILRVLYDDVLAFRPRESHWVNRDRLILSKGHGCLALYAILSDVGFFPKSHFRKFCAFDGLLGGHPVATIPGVEAATGSEGHGFPIAVGMAIYARRKNLKHKVITIVGDGETNEGSVWEAALSAVKNKLSNLTVIVDRNHQQSYGPTKEVSDPEPFIDKWRAFGFAAAEVNGHSVSGLKKILTRLPLSETKPGVVIAHTVKGKGIPEGEGNPHWHHLRGITDEDIQRWQKNIREYKDA